jgi:hypothetical protein
MFYFTSAAVTGSTLILTKRLKEQGWERYTGETGNKVQNG